VEKFQATPTGMGCLQIFDEHPHSFYMGFTQALNNYTQFSNIIMHNCVMQLFL